LNVKVYAIAFYVDVAASKLLEPLKGSSDETALCEACLSVDSFFVRQLVLTFARGVSSKQVTDAIAENLKAHLDEKILGEFGSMLSSGIGKSLDKGDSIAFTWTTPGAVGILVRQKPVGELSHPKLPRVLFRGFLGEKTAVPALRTTTVQGLPRLFQAAAAGGRESVGAKKGGRGAISQPTTVTEPATGLPLPSEITASPESTLSLLGCGVRVKKLGMISVNVYALGIYMDAHAAKPHLSAFTSGQPDPKLFEALLSKESFFPRMLNMVFARGVSAKQVADALGEKLKPNLPADVFDQFSNTVITGLGKGLNKGQSLAFLWSAPEHVSVIVNGNPAGDITHERLPRMLHRGFLGDDPSVPEAKAAIPAGVARLLSA